MTSKEIEELDKITLDKVKPIILKEIKEYLKVLKVLTSTKEKINGKLLQ